MATLSYTRISTILTDVILDPGQRHQVVDQAGHPEAFRVHDREEPLARGRVVCRTTRNSGYAVSLRIRKRIEDVFGWMKTTGTLHKTRHRGKSRVGWMFTLTAAYNLVRLSKLPKLEAV